MGKSLSCHFDQLLKNLKYICFFGEAYLKQTDKQTKQNKTKNICDFNSEF